MMKRKYLLFVLLMSASPFVAAAGDGKVQGDPYHAAQKTAASRYEADKKLCAEESNSSSRMQCLRDARAEYDKALAEAQKLAPAATAAKQKTAACADCGTVVGVVMGKKEGKGGPVGVIAGGVAGALLGSQIGSGSGKNVATIAGAAGGAYAGHKVEEKMTETKFWSVRVKLDSGEQRVFEYDHEPGVKSGDLVKVSGNTLTKR